MREDCELYNLLVAGAALSNNSMFDRCTSKNIGCLYEKKNSFWLLVSTSGSILWLPLFNIGAQNPGAVPICCFEMAEASLLCTCCEEQVLAVHPTPLLEISLSGSLGFCVAFTNRAKLGKFGEKKNILKNKQTTTTKKRRH